MANKNIQNSTFYERKCHFQHYCRIKATRTRTKILLLLWAFSWVCIWVCTLHTKKWCKTLLPTRLVKCFCAIFLLLLLLCQCISLALLLPRIFTIIIRLEQRLYRHMVPFHLIRYTVSLLIHRVKCLSCENK